LRVFENRVQKMILGPKKKEVVPEATENYIMRSFITCMLYHIFLG
jgi:hypothetical protein